MNKGVVLGLIGTIALIGASGFVLVLNSGDSQQTITLATTTSTDNSGLLDYLHPYLREELGLEVDVVAVGTGAAIEMGRQGLADAVIVHARSLEDEFVAEGYGVHRVDVMYNDFVVVGPKNDPAGIKEKVNSTEVFQTLFAHRQDITWVSRGDNSGTHVKELFLWDRGEVTIEGDNITWASQNRWYLETGSGMSDTLTVASEEQAYTLTDRGTWLFTKDNHDLTILAQGHPEFFNPYGAILVNPNKFGNGQIKFDLAKKYVQWLVSDKTQGLINNYTINGEQTFFADFRNHVSEMSAEELAFWGINEAGAFTMAPAYPLLHRTKDNQSGVT